VKLLDTLKSRTVMMRIHLVLTFTWVLLIIPTLLWWKSSILWVLMISIYANIASHWAAWQATKAEPKEANE